MRKVVVEHCITPIDIKTLVNRLLVNNDKLIVVYKAKSDNPYYAFLSRTSNYQYGFHCHIGVGTKMTFFHNTLKECLEAAIKGGKEILVFERDEMDKLFKFY